MTNGKITAIIAVVKHTAIFATKKNCKNCRKREKIMKIEIRLTMILLFTVFGIVSSNSQSVKDVKWALPSYETNGTGTMGSYKDLQAKQVTGTNDNSDFTPASDYYNTQSGLNVITFKLSKPGFVNIKIYDSKGNTVDELARSSFGTGEHEVKWNSSKFSAGSYYCSVITGEYSVTKKIK